MLVSNYPFFAAYLGQLYIYVWPNVKLMVLLFNDRVPKEVCNKEFNAITFNFARKAPRFRIENVKNFTHIQEATQAIDVQTSEVVLLLVMSMTMSDE